MNKRILFLYTTSAQKAELMRCEAVFKAIFRKFRNSAVFSYMELDLSPSCRNILSEKLKSALSHSDATLWHHDENGISPEKAFAQEVQGLYCEENKIVGRCVFHIPERKTVSFENSMLHYTSVVEADAIGKAVSIAANEAKRRCAPLTLCTDRKNEADRIFLREAELFLGEIKHLEINHISLDEFIHQSRESIPLYDVVLATEATAGIVSAHMSSGVKAPTGYTLWHTNGAPIFRREIFPYEEMGCLRLSSLMLSFAGLLEEAPETKSGGSWLRRCVGLALERCPDSKSFPDEVLREIEKPIRNRQVK